MTKKLGRWQAVVEWIIAVAVLAAVVIAVIRFGYSASWTGFGGKTLWDWFDLLVIPVVLAGGALLFNWTNQKTEREIAQQRRESDFQVAADQQQEATLQAYLDRMSELILQQELGKSKEGAKEREVARVRTLTVLQRLDKNRKGTVLLFLHGARLLDRRNKVVSLDGADLSEANLHKADLYLTDLSKTNLSGADLSEANLKGADLSRAKLSRANLRKANLSDYIEPDDDLYMRELDEDERAEYLAVRETCLRRADLEGTDLSGAKVADDRLGEAGSLKGTTMPDGTTHK